MLAAARSRRDRAESVLMSASDAVVGQQEKVDVERRAQQERQRAVEAIAPRRHELTQALLEIDAALDATRAERIMAMTREPPTHLVAALGAVPEDLAARHRRCQHRHRDRLRTGRDHHRRIGARRGLGPPTRGGTGGDRGLSQPRPWKRPGRVRNWTEA